MGSNTLSDVTNADRTTDAMWNQYRDAINDDILPRNSSGVVTDEAGNLGSSLIKWNNISVKDSNFVDYDNSPDIKTTSASLGLGECISDTNTSVVFQISGPPYFYVKKVKAYTITTRGIPVIINTVIKNKTSNYSGYVAAFFGADTTTRQNGFIYLAYSDSSATNSSGGVILNLEEGTYTITIYCAVTTAALTADIDIFIREVI
jgi:hypothetical protein